MTDNKRFENRLDKNNIYFKTLNPVWDYEKEDALNVFEMIDLLNNLHDENTELKQEVEDRFEEYLYIQKCQHSNELLIEQLKKRVKQLEKMLHIKSELGVDDD